MAKRKSTGKRLRFEVFKRDRFTCQYCGAQPPAVVLVADHIDPVAAGGPSDIANLITACEPCNQGKSDKALGASQSRPDADLLYLETQQEIAELRRYRASLARRDEAIDEYVSELRDRFFDIIAPKKWGPTEVDVRRLVRRYGHEIAFTAVTSTAEMIARGRLWNSYSQFVPYMFGVARHTEEEEDA